MNGIELEDPQQKLLDAMLDMAKGELSKRELAENLKGLWKK
jgi:prophage maintenance system killer protein